MQKLRAKNGCAIAKKTELQRKLGDMGQQKTQMEDELRAKVAELEGNHAVLTEHLGNTQEQVDVSCTHSLAAHA